MHKLLTLFIIFFALACISLAIPINPIPVEQRLSEKTETNVTMTGDLLMSGPGTVDQTHIDHIQVTGDHDTPAATHSISVGHVVLNQQGVNVQISEVDGEEADATNYLLTFQTGIVADGLFHTENGADINVDQTIDAMLSGQGSNSGSATTSIQINKE